MNQVDFEFATDVRRHLLGLVAAIDRWRERQPGVVTHQTAQISTHELAGSQPPRQQPAMSGGRMGERDGSSFRT
jgi:hypothetical protein